MQTDPLHPLRPYGPRGGARYCAARRRPRQRPWALWVGRVLLTVLIVIVALCFVDAWGNALDQQPGHGMYSPEALAVMGERGDALREQIEVRQAELEEINAEIEVGCAHLSKHERLTAEREALPPLR